MPRTRAGLIALLTDFGTRDWYVATMKGVMLTSCPGARIVDITHEIPPQDVVAGAFTLAAASPWFPRGTVFVAVVDPGVGSDRAIVAIRAEGRYFIGPDNGVLWLAVERARAPIIIRLSNRRYWLDTVSQTFQGRDIMAPVAAHLAQGGSLASLGVRAAHMTPVSLPPLQHHGRRVRGAIVHMDAFGNLITNLPSALLSKRQRSGPAGIRYKDRKARVVSSYSEGRPDELIAVVGSLGLVELAVREGSAAWMLNARRGDAVEIVLT